MNFSSLRIRLFLILANSDNPDEMPPYAVFHVGLYYLKLYPD